LEPGGTVPDSGDQSIMPLQDSVYRLTATNAFGSKAVLLGINVSEITPTKNQRPVKPLRGSKAEPFGLAVEARNCDLVKNTVIRGAGWLQTESDADQSSTAQCDVHIPAAGNYELFIKYASDEMRPVRVTLNNYIIQEKALAATTGGWSDPNAIDQTLGVVKLNVGKNILQIYSEHALPHIQQVRFKPVL
jgi:hypothetical protein